MAWDAEIDCLLLLTRKGRFLEMLKIKSMMVVKATAKDSWSIHCPAGLVQERAVSVKWGQRTETWDRLETHDCLSYNCNCRRCLAQWCQSRCYLCCELNSRHLPDYSIKLWSQKLLNYLEIFKTAVILLPLWHPLAFLGHFCGSELPVLIADL